MHYLFAGFFLASFAVGLIRLIFFGNVEILPAIISSTFDMAKVAFEISIGLTGILTLWLGLMKIGEAGGVIALFSKAISPLFARIFPGIPKGHPAGGSVLMNIAANMLGLDNAATPLGLKAMKEMQEINPQKDTASDAQIMFLVLNTSGLTILPISIMAYREEMGAVNPADIFLPILLATFFSTLTGLITVGIMQKIKLWDRVILAYLGSFTILVIGLIWMFTQMPKQQMNLVSNQVSNLILISVISLFIIMGLRKKINIYESFIEGAKEGFWVAVKIIPYLVAILVAIGVFRASGILEGLVEGIRVAVNFFGLDDRFVEALPTAFMKPLSGSGARGMMVATMEIHGADSFPGRIASTIQGATETTFYVLAVYFGSVGIRNTRYAVPAGLLADFAGILAGILLGYVFFG